MKKLLFFAIATLFLASCAQEEPQQPKEMVDVTFNYMFAESGDMARSTADDAYTTFYNEQIKTKKLTPQHYTLYFKTASGNSVYTLKSRWDRNTKFNLLEGEYTVTGTSAPITNTIDTLYLKFEEKVTISKDNPIISLTAINDCFLLLFEAEDINSIEFKKAFETTASYTVNTFNPTKLNDLYFAFNHKMVSYNSATNTIDIKYNDNSSNSINLNFISFSKGKYYFFNRYSNSFDVPAMEAGN